MIMRNIYSLNAYEFGNIQYVRVRLQGEALELCNYREVVDVEVCGCRRGLCLYLAQGLVYNQTSLQVVPIVLFRLR